MTAAQWYIDTLIKYIFDGGLSAHWMERVNAFTQGKVAAGAIIVATPAIIFSIIMHKYLRTGLLGGA